MVAKTKNRRKRIKTLVSALFVAALFWLIRPETSPANLNNQVPSAVKATKVKVTVKPAAQRTEAKPIQAEPTGETAPATEVAKDTTPVINPAPTPPEPDSNEEIMAAAGIPKSDWAAVDYIVHHESTWNPSAINPASGSCGLVQELPCGKSGCRLGDGVCQLRWATQYATARYGSWWGAQAFWASARWW